MVRVMKTKGVLCEVGCDVLFLIWINAVLKEVIKMGLII